MTFSNAARADLFALVVVLGGCSPHHPSPNLPSGQGRLARRQVRSHKERRPPLTGARAAAPARA